jgi:hypothetical protein
MTTVTATAVSDAEIDARRNDDPAEHVAAELVGAEEMRRRRGCRAAGGSVAIGS